MNAAVLLEVLVIVVILELFASFDILLSYYFMPCTTMSSKQECLCHRPIALEEVPVFHISY